MKTRSLSEFFHSSLSLQPAPTHSRLPYYHGKPLSDVLSLKGRKGNGVRKYPLIYISKGSR